MQNYVGFDEVHTSPPLGHHLDLAAITLLPRPLELNLCSRSCLTYTTPILSSKSYVFDPLHLIPPRSTTPPQSCTGPEPIPGAYVATALPSVLYPPVPLPFASGSLTAGLYDFVPSGCTYQHDGLRFRNHSSCTEKRQAVYFTGDSHARSM